MKLKLILLFLVICRWINGQNITADFTYSVSCNTVCFTDVSVSNSGLIVSRVWDFGDASLNSSSSNPCHVYLSSGVFLVKLIVIDINGDSDTISKPITVSFYMTTTITSTNASCNGICDGSAVIGITGGTSPYSYSSTPAAINTVNPANLCAGIYTVTVTDANGCMTSGMLAINTTVATSLPNATVTSVSYNETCYHSGDGSIDVSINGSNPGPFTYLWSNGASTQDLTNITSNIYQLYITDGNSHCMTIQDTIYSEGINCGTLSGNVFIDNNSDCIKNTGDNSYSNSLIVITPGNRLGYPNSLGDFIVNDLPYGTYSISLNANNSNLSPSCTTTITTTVNAGNPNSINNDLSLGFNSATQPDMNVSIYATAIVPGFSNRVYYNLKNLNNVNADGILKVTLPNAIISAIINVNPSTYTVSGDTVLWNFNAFNYYTNSIFHIDFITPLTIPLGNIFLSCAYATTTVPDFDLSNNSICYQRLVTGSFDPNDKSVSPVGIGTTGNISANETDLTYLIRFQNTGNGAAVNIVVKDTLSSNLDVSTFEMLSSSHNYNIDILQGNVLRWKFNNIMLPDSNSNEPASHGYIQYKIKRTSNNTPGTQIKNTAYIYFDFNEPVVTNTTLNTIDISTSIFDKQNNNNECVVYPNCTNGLVTVQSSDEMKQIELSNIAGQLLLSEIVNEKSHELQLQNFTKGIYFVKVVYTNGMSITKKVVKQ